MDLDLIVQRFRGSAPTDQEVTGVHRAAVAAVFRPGPDLLFIRRAEVQGDPWSGHMAFPGGRVDPTDSGPEGAVYREVREELGLDLGSRGRLLGELESQLTPITRPPMLIHAFVFALSDASDLVLSPDSREVAAFHWIPWEILRTGQGRATMPWTWQGMQIQLPCVHWQGERIWGLTLRMVDDLVARLTR